MDIESITRYRVFGREFRSLGEVRRHVEDEIGKIIDSTPNRLNPRDRIAIFDAIVKHHDKLTQLLAVEFSADDELQPEVKNILDMDL